MGNLFECSIQRICAERDLNHVRENTDLPKLPVYPTELSKIPHGKLDTGKKTGIGDGVLFITYSLLMASRSGGPKLKIQNTVGGRQSKDKMGRQEENELSQDMAMDTMCSKGSRLHQVCTRYHSYV